MKPSQSDHLPEAGSALDTNGEGVVLPRLVGLLQCAYAWEWRRRRVIVAYGRLWRDLFDGVAALLMAVVTIPVTILRLIISPLYWLVGPAIICLCDPKGIALLEAKWRRNKPNDKDHSPVGAVGASNPESNLAAPTG